MATIRFYLQSKKNPAGIYVRLREGRTVDAKAKTNYAINPADWSALKGKPKNLKDDEGKSLNQKLDKLQSKLLNHYNDSTGKETINSIWLKEFINPSLVKNIPTKLVAYFDHYSKSQKGAVSPATLTKANVNKHLLERFEAATKKSYEIKEVDLQFKSRFEDYCKSENYAPGTVARAIRYIKTVCYHARDNGVEVHFQLTAIKTKKHKTATIFLTETEIEDLIKKEFKEEHLDTARDWLIIACETAQRVSDFLNFSSDIIREEAGLKLIEFIQKKTGKATVVPISKRLQKVLDKRNGEFPRKMSSQRLNEHIKTVCQKAEIDSPTEGSIRDKKINRDVQGVYPKYKLVTSHIGRRSFATNYYGQYPTALLISVTNHATEQQFLEYIGKTETDRAKQLAYLFHQNNK